MWSSRRCLPAPLAGSLSSSSRPATRGCSSGCRSVCCITYLGHFTFCYAGAKGWQGWGVVQEGMHCIAEMRNFFYVLINLKRGDHLHLRIHEYVAGEWELEQPSSTWKRSCWWRFRRWLAWRVTSRFSISLLSPFTAPPLLQFGGVGY